MTAYTTASEQETEAVAEGLAHLLKEGSVLAFRGGLGAGKTAFVRGLCRGLGIGAHVSSPTFALVHEYRGEKAVLHHFDMYRVEGIDSLESTGFFDYLGQGSILAVEWSENIGEFLPGDAILVEIRTTGETTREILLEGGPF